MSDDSGPKSSLAVSVVMEARDLDRYDESLGEDSSATYMRYTQLPYSKRPSFREDLLLTERGRLHSKHFDREEALIGEFRAPFGNGGDAKFQKLMDFHDEWMRIAYEEREKSREKIKLEVQSEIKRKLPDDKRKWQKRQQGDYRILDRVNLWNLPAGGTPKESREVVDATKYLISYLIKVKKGKGGVSEFHSLNSTFDGPTGSPLKEKCEDGTIRYFHLPANNMAWVEQAMARYCERPEGGRELEAKHILRHEYWRGQQRWESGDPVHARHMRSQCSLLLSRYPVTPSLDIRSPHRHFAIFMPYLHWESDKSRAQMAEAIGEANKEEEMNSRKITEMGNELEKLERAETHRKKLRDAATDVAAYRALTGVRGKEEPKGDKLKIALASYLMQAAVVYAARDCEVEERLLHHALHQHAPLHARRTLDQSYFWTLEDTERRDRDQVVYRATKASKSPKVVMVDQLWMWVLDENTIITSFPRNWSSSGLGSPPGVYESIKECLERSEADEVKSVWDVALIIIDQCSGVFFNRADQSDGRPEVIDMFAKSMADITKMKTIAAEAFWRSIISPCQRPGSKNPYRSHLNINPEGKLLVEMQDISEELRMMKKVFEQQLHVVRTFKKTLDRIQASDANRNSMQRAPDPPGRTHDPGINGSLTNGNTNTLSYLTDPDLDRSYTYRALDLVEDIEVRVANIQLVKSSASRTCVELRELLDLKQQQTSILDTRLSLERATESVRQGRTIMVFTIVTIFFLPLGFVASIFGMNAQEFNGTSSIMHIHEELMIMFSASAVIIVISICFAFSDLLGKLTTGLLKIGWSYVFVFFGFQAISRRLQEKNVNLEELEQRHWERVYARHYRKAMEKVKKQLEDKDKDKVKRHLVGKEDMV